MGVPRTYRKSSEQLINFNFTDLVAGTGIIFFDGYAAKITAGAETRYLGQNIPHSNPANFGVGAGTLAKDFTLTSFNSPRKIRGRIEFFYCQRIQHTSGTVTAQTTFTVKRYNASDASTDTLGTVTGLTDSDTIDNIHNNVAFIDFDTDQNFKIGDKLIIGVSLVSTGNGQAVFYHDPRNIAIAGIGNGDENTFFKIKTPFKIQF